MELALCPYSAVARRRHPLGGRENWGTEFALESETYSSSRRDLSDGNRRHRCRGTICSQQLAGAQPHSEPGNATRKHERRGRRAARSFLSEFSASLRQPENSQQVFHGV